MFGIEKLHFIPVYGLIKHNKKTMEFMDIFQNKMIARMMPGALVLSFYNAAIFLGLFSLVFSVI